MKSQQTNVVGRRTFIGGAGVAVAAIAAGTATGAMASEASQSTCTFADTVSWDGSYDVVVMGAGDAGMTAAVNAARAGADVLLFDVAPEWEAGGNSRYCGQTLSVGVDKAGITEYYKALYGKRPYDEEVIDAYVEGNVNLIKTIEEDFGVTTYAELVPPPGYEHAGKAEYPEFPGGESIRWWNPPSGGFDSYLYQAIRNTVEAEPTIDTWYNARGTKLIQDPATKTIVGVEIEKDGELRRIRASNGVVIASGGFECNREMLCDYADIDSARPMGGVHNDGSGIKLAQEVGADLWHMDCFNTTNEFPYCVDVDTEVNEHAIAIKGHAGMIQGFLSGSYIIVTKDGTRFQSERGSNRHGRIYLHGEWRIPACPDKGFAIMDSAQLADMENDGRPFMPGVRESFIEANTVEELAENIGCSPEVLSHTIEKFNMFCEEGEDYAFGRSPETMRPIVEAPFYAIPMTQVILNTMGGPRRNARAEIVDVNGNPIPHLYGAGECGSMYGKDYEGGGNLAECLIFGKIAGLNAAEAKDPLPKISAEPVESNIVYTAGSGSCERAETRTYDLAENQAVGTGRSIGGEIDVMITMDGDTITDCQVVYEHETKGYGSMAVEQLPARIVEANGPDVDTITNATMASSAIRIAVMDAVEQLGN